MTRPPLVPTIAALPTTVPFVGAETIERRRGRAFRARVGANESNFGPSPRVVRAIAEAANESWKYGDAETFDLKQGLAAHLGVAAEAIVIGEGIDGLLGTLCRLYVEPDTPVVTSAGAYPTFNYHVAAQGGRLVTVPFHGAHEDPDALVHAARREQARIVYLSNPDNPMGSWWSAERVEAFIAAVPEETVIVLDEAYGEYAPPGTLPPLETQRPNLLRFRTFSKAYGLAGLRVGYAIGHPETIAAFDAIRNHFGVNRLGQIAAVEALADQDWLGTVLTRTRAGRDTLDRHARALDLVPLPSATNFVTMDCGGDAIFAQKVLEGLAERDVFIRKPHGPGLDHCIRISVGEPEEIEFAAEALAATLRALGR